MGAVGVGLLWDSRLLKLDMNERTISRLLSAIASHMILLSGRELTSISGRHLGIGSLEWNESVVYIFFWKDRKSARSGLVKESTCAVGICCSYDVRQ
jgi:hypothetical protein